MFNVASYAVIAFTLASSVSSLVVPRATPPSGWDAQYLEPYTTYNTRYLALGCQNQHGKPFFDQCCHPLPANQGLETRPPQCTPSTPASSSASAALPTSTVVPSDDDDDLPFCEDDDEDSTPTSSSAPLTTQAPPAPTKTPVVAPTTAPKPTTTTKASAPASAPDVPSSGVNAGGFATFFYQNGVAGACGTVHGDNDMIAAIDGRRYGNLNAKSALCGKKVQITNPVNKKSVTVTIADACPTCKNSNSIDLSEGAFKKIASLEQGMVGIKWSFV